MMVIVIDQFETDNHTEKVFKRLISLTIVSSSRDPARAATKGISIRGMPFTSSPCPDVSLVGKKNSYEADQENLKAFFCQNPTPACVSSDNNVAVDDN